MVLIWLILISSKPMDSALFYQYLCGKFLLESYSAFSNKRDMLKMKGITEQKIDKIYEAATKIE
jgi:hypothetical protein